MEPLSSQQSLTSRIQSVDFIRGLVVILMAIDHVRVYSGLPAGGPEPGIFFTRWVTHFCAPLFVFLSGTSAYLYGIKLNDYRKLARYLLTRGFLLIVLELTLIRYCWTFNFNYSQFTLAGVIWMIGWCMVLLALLVRLPAKTVGVLGLFIIFFQNIFGLVPSFFPESLRVSFGHFWEFIYSSGLEGPSFMNILYVIVPWIGVMAAGYGFGLILQMEETNRKRILIWIGAGASLAFLIFDSLVIFLAPPPENSSPFIFQLLNQRKYPASQLYLLMTLGPAILLMPYVEKATTAISRVIVTFGRVPFFYYLLHIPIIHISALIVQLMVEGQTHPEWYASAPFSRVPEDQRWSLPMLYLVFLIDIVILFFACRWYESYKRNHPEKSWVKFV